MEDLSKKIEDLQYENNIQKRMLYVSAAINLLLMICLAATMALVL